MGLAHACCRMGQSRDVRAVYTSWQRARDVADRLPITESERFAMRIEPRMLISGNSWRLGISLDETGFNELRQLAPPVETICRWRAERPDLL